MFRIRFHGRGGQDMKSASRILGTAFFRAGYRVQDAPRYGAERRKPVDENLKLQGRFRQLFEPGRDASAIAEIQARVDAYREKATPG